MFLTSECFKVYFSAKKNCFSKYKSGLLHGHKMRNSHYVGIAEGWERKTSIGVTSITAVKNVGQAMFEINCREGSAAKSSHRGNIANQIGRVGKHPEHCAAHCPDAKCALCCTAAETVPFGWRNTSNHSAYQRVTLMTANIKRSGGKVYLCTHFWRV